MAYRSQLPKGPSSGSINLPEWLTELRETLTYLYQSTKGHDKSTRAQPDEEIPRVRSGRVLNIGASVPVGLEGITLPG